MENINTIIWDWNGTLLDDTEICRSIVNKLLEERGEEKLSIERYKDIFTFPVKDYYEEAGFDFSKEDFSTPADAFIKDYNAKVPEAPLHKNANEILDLIAKKQKKQIIISAMKQDALQASVLEKGIDHYFEEISGINDHYANGKIENAKRILKKLDLDPKNCLLIGDTIHDHEVAETLDCECILIAGGHQSYERLLKTKRKVYHSIKELMINV